MVVFYLRNSQAPDNKIVPLTVSLQLDPVKSYEFPSRPDQDPTATGTEFPNLFDPEGDSIWILVVAPPRTELDKDTGLPIPPEIVNVVSEDTLHKELEAALGRIGSRVVWPGLLDDTHAPQVTEIQPSLNETDVSILSNVIYRITEPLPAAGLDLDTLNITVNGLPLVVSGVTVPGEDVDFKGNVFDFNIIYRPKRDTS
jgi:hypothetical protein